MTNQSQPVNRAYDSSGRRARAVESRRRIVSAAHDLFVSGGYGGTSIADIAKAAEVSAPTVYAAFGTKAALLKVAIDVALAGDDEPVPMVDRPLSIWVYEADRADELVQRSAVMMGVVASRAAPIFDVLVRAADADPELATLLADLEHQRLRASTRIARAIDERDGLPSGRSVEEARDVIWVCSAPEVYVNLTTKRRWSTKRYVAWAANTLTKLVLEPPVDLPPSPPPP
jgi:AcrR family transcriptional regulator